MPGRVVDGWTRCVCWRELARLLRQSFDGVELNGYSSAIETSLRSFASLFTCCPWQCLIVPRERADLHGLNGDSIDDLRKQVEVMRRRLERWELLAFEEDVVHLALTMEGAAIRLQSAWRRRKPAAQYERWRRRYSINAGGSSPWRLLEIVENDLHASGGAAPLSGRRLDLRRASTASTSASTPLRDFKMDEPTAASSDEEDEAGTSRSTGPTRRRQRGMEKDGGQASHATSLATSHATSHAEAAATRLQAARRGQVERRDRIVVCVPEQSPEQSPEPQGIRARGLLQGDELMDLVEVVEERVGGLSSEGACEQYRTVLARITSRLKAADGPAPTLAMYERRDAALLLLPDEVLRAEYASSTAAYLATDTPSALRGMAEMLLIRLGEIMPMPHAERRARAQAMLTRRAEEREREVEEEIERECLGIV